MSSISQEKLAEKYPVLDNIASLPKIHAIQVPKDFQPDKADLRYPSYARDYGVEQDFLEFLEYSYPATTKRLVDADFVFLPIFWTRYHLNHNYGREGIKELQELVVKALGTIGNVPTFTVCQYDDGPLIDVGATTLFLSSRKTNFGIDIPLLSEGFDRILPRRRPKQTIFANFSGRVDTHPIRSELVQILEDDPRVVLPQVSLSPKRFAKLLATSQITFCPRGYGGSSFRFYEAIRAGSIPWLVGDLDTRPFKEFLEWDEVSLYSSELEDVRGRLTELSPELLEHMASRLVRDVAPFMQMGSWCWLAILQLMIRE